MSAPIRVDTPTLRPSPESATSAFPSPPALMRTSLDRVLHVPVDGPMPAAMQSTQDRPTTDMSSRLTHCLPLRVDSIASSTGASSITMARSASSVASGLLLPQTRRPIAAPHAPWVITSLS